MFSGEYDHECLDMLKALATMASDAIGAVLLFGGIVGVWFIGCGLA